MRAAAFSGRNHIAVRAISSPAIKASSTDQVLVAGLRHGEDWALVMLYESYARLVFSLSLRILSDRDAAEEAVQEVFIKIWRRAADFDPGRAKFSTWIARIAHNHAIDEWRRRARRPALGDATPSESIPDPIVPVDVAVADWEHQKIVHALARIPNEQRKAIELAYWEGLTHKEIAEKLGEPIGTVKTRIRRGMQKMKVLLEQEED